MPNSVKERLLLTLISLALLWLVCMGLYVLIKVQDLRSFALTECIKESFNLFDYCFKKTNDDIRLSITDFFSPFIPSAVLIWIFWLFKVDMQIEKSNVPIRLVKTVIVVCYLIAAIAIFVPLYLVAEIEDAKKLYEILWYNLFVMPWLGISLISAPIIYQRLSDKQKIISEFKRLRVLIWIVAASPFIAILLIFVRGYLNY